MQILHKLRITEKTINISSTLCLPLLPSDTASTLIEQRSSGSGQQRCWTPLPSRNGRCFRTSHSLSVCSFSYQHRPRQRVSASRSTEIVSLKTNALGRPLRTSQDVTPFGLSWCRFHLLCNGSPPRHSGDKLHGKGRRLYTQVDAAHRL